MNKNDRAIIRSVYQAIPTDAEKALFEKVMGGTREDKLNWILAQAPLPITEEQRLAILAATSFTKADRIAIAGGFIRSLIFKLFGI